ncbi:hypothetical protein HJG60_008582 [Phyllostomus discolor]|uniref:Uncharacterized protein n=1 Tax=Phyllostomus discolor TaxID=89673 RepID=A0A834DKF1_9CHIR|nr:hypothetical protein HJG60_008582 [Phyllostomus discolor]
MNSCSTLLNTREMKIKNTVRYHLTPVKIAISSVINKQVLARMWRKGNPHTLLVGLQIGAAIMENTVEVPQKIKNDPAITLLGVYPKKYKTLTKKDTCTLIFIPVLLTAAKIWKQPKCHQYMSA